MHGRTCFGDHPTHLAKENMCYKTSCDIFSCGKVHGSDLNDWFHGFVESLTQNLLRTAENNSEFRCAIMTASQRISQQMAAEERAAQLADDPYVREEVRPTPQVPEELGTCVIHPIISPFDVPEEGDVFPRSGHLHVMD